MLSNIEQAISYSTGLQYAQVPLAFGLVIGIDTDARLTEDNESLQLYLLPLILEEVT